MLILKPEEIRAAEEKANENGLSYEEMMETAGRGCADFIIKKYPREKNAVILVGKGKNGGDGYVIARCLQNAGKTVSVIRLFSCPSDALSEKMRSRLPQGVRLLSYETQTADCLAALYNAQITVDAVFGIGFQGTLPPHIKEVFDRVNAIKTKRIAVDVPSGGYFQARHTLSMLCLKPAHVYKPAAFSCGEVHVIPIGFAPPAPEKETVSYLKTEAFSALPPRPFDSHKGSFGHTLILGGCRTMPGAPVIAAKGALRAGSGLTTLSFPDVIYSAVTAQLTQSVFLPLLSAENGEISAENIPLLESVLPKFTAVVLGNGMGQSEDVKKITEFIIKNADCPVIADADGINAIAGNIDILNTRKSPLLLTPHPGEMGRLTGRSPAEINENREETALKFAADHGVYLLLKGANTVIASPEGKRYVNPTGSPALSRGGSGDLLAGMVGALISQGKSPFEALCLGAYFHGLAGERAEKKYGPYASTVDRIAGELFRR